MYSALSTWIATVNTSNQYANAQQKLLCKIRFILKQHLYLHALHELRLLHPAGRYRWPSIAYNYWTLHASPVAQGEGGDGGMPLHSLTNELCIYSSLNYMLHCTLAMMPYLSLQGSLTFIRSRLHHCMLLRIDD